jgi:alpha-L-fucosidase
LASTHILQEGKEPQEKIIGMYINQHLVHNRPYTARTWSQEDWHAYRITPECFFFNSIDSPQWAQKNKNEAYAKYVLTEVLQLPLWKRELTQKR